MTLRLDRLCEGLLVVLHARDCVPADSREFEAHPCGTNFGGSCGVESVLDEFAHDSRRAQIVESGDAGRGKAGARTGSEE